MRVKTLTWIEIVAVGEMLLLAAWAFLVAVEGDVLAASPAGQAVEISCEPAAEYPAENCIQCKVSQGEEADLASFSDQLRSRVIRACFLQSLLTNSVVPHQGVHIKNAIVTNQFDLSNMEIRQAVELAHCEFLDFVDCSATHFLKNLSFPGSVFYKSVSFDDARIDGSVYLSNTLFLHDADFEHIQVAGDLTAEGAYFNKGANFNGAKVGHSATMDGVELFLAKMNVATDRRSLDEMKEKFKQHQIQLLDERPVIFGKESTHWLLLDEGSHGAYSLWKKADGVQVIRATFFGDKLDFSGATIGKKLTATEARCYHEAKFDSTKVGDSVCLDYALFGGKVSWGFAVIANGFYARNAQFAQSSANFCGFHCGEADFGGSFFREGADFGNAVMDNQFLVHSATFGGANVSQFFSIKVHGSAYFQETRFAQPVSFILAEIDGNFDATGARFEDQTSQKELEDMTRGHHPFSFNADFGSMKVGGFTFFNDARFAGRVSLRNARFQYLHLDRVSWPQYSAGGPPTNTVRLEGMSYQRIRSITEEDFNLTREELVESWRQLEKTLDKHTPYTFDVYDSLQSYFHREGEADLVDEVLIEGKRQERKQALKPYSASWFLNEFLDLTVVYGRRPSRAFWISMCVILGSSVLFYCSLRKMPSTGAPGALASPPRKLDCLWFSLDLFLPVVDLNADDPYAKASGGKSQWTKFCICTVIILGHILVPIWVAALAGLIK